jgi:hypothetical protein
MTHENSQDQPPLIAKPDDIDRTFAMRAFSGTSFDPEKRGQARRDEYVNAVNGFYAELWPLAKTDEQKALLATEMERYRQGRISMTNAYLASHSNVVSSMIAGPSNFPVARMQKRSQWADNKLNGLIEWDKRARAAVRQKLLDARPDEVKADHAWRVLARDIQSSLNVIEAIDAGQSPYTRSAFVNSIAAKVERLAANGETELVAKALQLVRDYNASHKKPAISERHKFWSLGQSADSAAQRIDAAQSSEPSVIAKGEGIEIVANPQADRVQIVFAAKPDVQMIGKLKAEAWKWSPSNGAWQRKLTEAAKASAVRIVGL